MRVEEITEGRATARIWRGKGVQLSKAVEWPWGLELSVCTSLTEQGKQPHCYPLRNASGASAHVSSSGCLLPGPGSQAFKV